LGGTDLILSFGDEVNDGSISSLKMAFQSNAVGEQLTVSGFEIHGTAVPEPTSIAWLFMLMLGTRRGRRS
jgi:hypothetical protein